jgi:tRNA pseudouridine38-40 synthase
MLIYWLSWCNVLLKIVKWKEGEIFLFKTFQISTYKCNFENSSLSMNRYFLEISYLGTHYHGWQLQPNATTVQMVLEDSLKLLTGDLIKTTGAGRTDTGVHARHFTLHFDSGHSLFLSGSQCVYKLNCILPADISVKDLYPVKPEAHARFSALSRTYEYRINQHKDPFDTHLSWYFSRPLDLAAMNQAAFMLKDYSDFTSFSKLHSDVKTNLCHIKEAIWSREGGQIIFTVTADRFLRNMVRAIVGTMIDVGLGNTDVRGFKNIIEGRDRRLAGFSVPAHGLYLLNINYPELRLNTPESDLP